MSLGRDPRLASAVLVLAGICAACGTPTGAGIDAPSFVITQIPAGEMRVELQGRLDPDSRYPTGSRIVQVAGVGARARVIGILSEGLSAAGAPDLSFDAEAVLFTGRERPDSPWAIYERRLRDSRPRLVVDRGRDCIDPAYLPGDRVVFACRDRTGWSLHTASLDGSAAQRITFGPSAFDPDTLPDGRILFTMWDSQKDAPSGLFTVNPDGTLIEPFAGMHEGPDLKMRARATHDGRILLLAADADGSPAHAEQLEVRYPDDTPRDLAIDGFDPTSIEPLGPGKILIAGRNRRPGEGSNRTGGVHSLRQDTSEMEDIFDDPEWDEVEAVSVTPGDPPRGRPSMVNDSLATGQIVCYDSSRSASRAQAEPVSVAVLSGDEASPAASLQSDHSFFMEVPADVPLRIRTFDREGKTITTSDPFWVRPGEVRACFGCHAGHGSAPVNRRVEALAAPPMTVRLQEENAE